MINYLERHEAISMKYARRTEIEPAVATAGVGRYSISTKNIMMVAIEFANGPSGKPFPPHSHTHEQISYIVSGKVAFYQNGEKTVLTRGDLIVTPSDVSHSIKLLSKKAKIVDAFHPIREDLLD